MPEQSPAGEQNQILVDPGRLITAVTQLWLTYGLDSEAARQLTETFVTADRAGVSTHGLMALSGYIKRLDAQGFNLQPHYQIVRSSAAFAVVDADNAIGMLSAHYCMQLAIERVAAAGVFTVFCRSSNTFGPAFVYPRLATARGLIGLAISNSPAAMPVSNGREPLLGTNPFAIAVPCGRYPAIEFDMATSLVAKSKINEARLSNQAIPLGWALDQDGQPTTDPVEAIRGLVLPMAGHKGAGLAMSIDILSGVLSGASFLNRVGKFYGNTSAMDVGQMFVVIDPRQVMGPDYDQVMEDYVQTIRQSRAIEGQEIHLPGDGRHQMELRSDGEGIQLSQATYANLVQFLDQHQISIPQPLED
ncbi:MAG: Ldh family oxidoreductase [Eubacteriales bacterium]|nr:Ldh family oxidoreductase [Eubacteriales bacterium]